MLEWTDEAIVLTARPHGESGAIVSLLTELHGRHSGFVRGGQGRQLRPVLQPGNAVSATWSARLSEHMGNLSLESTAAHAARYLDDRARLAALASSAAVCDRALPDREPHPASYHGLLALIEALAGAHWAEAYVQWEVMLLKDLGYGLDLETCAAGGSNDQLAYVSPRTGRAVSRSAGEPYADRLLPLPRFLIGRGRSAPDDIAMGLRLTAHFLALHVFYPQNSDLPAARKRLTDALAPRSA
ncbi:DNA repair protein RecO [Algihabitans albus]|uniref:DNA repair protein RecO n=1 Tax=Algihabitans albus TaxID=2164067 RepID=UPI000E5C57DA|nr:DNA repair protein RecO [Algihabitans albus]